MNALDRIDRIIQWYGDYDTSHDYGDFDLAVELEQVRVDIAAEKEKHRWISVSEKLPMQYATIQGYYHNTGEELKYSPEHEYFSGTFCYRDGVAMVGECGEYFSTITHWRYPHPPEREE